MEEFLEHIGGDAVVCGINEVYYKVGWVDEEGAGRRRELEGLDCESFVKETSSCRLVDLSCVVLD